MRECRGMRTLILGLALGSILASLPVKAQSKSYVLKAARLFDGTRISSPGLVVVTGNKIFEVGSGSSIPSGAEVIDFGDATLSPGFIDAHTHLSMDDSGNFQRMLVDGLQKNIPADAINARESP
jgi:imidazolonepropionase-like amidohydrolase